MTQLPLTFSIKRILRDLQEFQSEPIPWVSICMPNKDYPFVLHSNIMIQDGIYKDVLIPVVIRLPQDYPLSPPAANIAPNHPFDRFFHEHIIGGGTFGASICTDLLSNFGGFFSKFQENGKPIISGWTPVYTLSSILIQLQVFFADPDLPKSWLPTPEEITEMKQKATKFTFDIKISDGSESTTVTHSYNNPYPAFSLSVPETTTGGMEATTTSEVLKSLDETIEAKKYPSKGKKSKVLVVKQKQIEVFDQNENYHAQSTTSSQRMRFEIRNKLICPVTKNDVFSEPMPIFGYPIFIETDQFDRIWPTPVIEIISQEGLKFYKSQPTQSNYNLMTGNYTSVFGKEFNFWLPLYINEKHYIQSKDEVLDVILKIYNLVSQKEKKEKFEPKMVLKVLPPILVKTVIHLLKGDVHQSYAALDAYCQFYWLFMKLVTQFSELQQAIDDEVEQFINDEEFRHKRRVGDLGEFRFKLLLSKYGIHNKEINEAVLSEFFTRQVSWAKGKNVELKKGVQVINLVKKFMSATAVSNQFLIVQIETAKLMVNDLVRAKLEENFGVIDPVVLDQFMKKTKWIKRNVTDDWRVLVKSLELDEIIRSENEIKELIEIAFDKEEEKYSRWGQLKCSVTNLEFKDPKQPIFGYVIHTYPSFVLIPTLVCNFVPRDSQWIPLYINSEHFERAQKFFNKNIISIYHLMVHEKLEKPNLSQIIIKVFCHTLAQSTEKISLHRKVQFPMVIAYIQVLWTFWKVIERNEIIQKLLDEEVTMLIEKGKVKDLSWLELREFIVKLVLSKKSNDSLNTLYLLLEELIRRSAKSAIGNIRRNDNDGFDCQKFGKFSQEQIKLSLVQISLLKIVLQDNYRIQLDHRLGNLRGHEIQNIRSQLIDIYKQRYYDLWKNTIQVLDLQNIIKSQMEMSNLTREKYQEVIHEEKMEALQERKKIQTITTYSPIQSKSSITQTLSDLGMRFVVKVHKNKK